MRFCGNIEDAPPSSCIPLHINVSWTVHLFYLRVQMLSPRDLALLCCILGVCVALALVLSPVAFRFNVIYTLNLWGSRDSRSGRGSAFETTCVIRQALANLLPRVRTFLDVPCGDFHWMALVRSGVRDFDSKYVGVDRVEALVKRNKQRFPTLDFRIGDVETMRESAQLVLMRDLLQHVKTDTQLAILRSLKANGNEWLLVNYDPKISRNSRSNIDPAPDWCEINLELPPFSMKPAKIYTSDSLDKHYGLFRLAEKAQNI